METESGLGIRNRAGTGAEVGIKMGVRTGLVFEAENEIGSQAKIVGRADVGSGTEFGPEVGVGPGWSLIWN